MNRVRNKLLIAGLGGALICLLEAFRNRQQFFISYLFAYQFWFGIAVGCLGLIMLHALTGGAWGELIRPLLEAGMMTLPWLALLFVPLAFGMQTLYPWARPELLAQDVLLQHKHTYLNVPFFWLRAATYFLLWSWMAWRLRDWSRQRDSGNQEAARHITWHSGPGLILYFLSLTFAALDWMMSLEPHWYSTIYEALIIVGHVLAAFAFVTCALYLFQRPIESTGHEEARVKPFWDLGNMVLAFVMFWAYLAFSQYLIIWSGNLPEEITWYLHRQQGGWFWVAMALIVFQFVGPFLALLGKGNKQRLERLVWIAAVILVIHLVELYWLVEPAFFPSALHWHWLDLAVPLSLGALWMASFISQLEAS